MRQLSLKNRRPALKFTEPGTPVFFVPIRYWETQEPETGSIADHGEELERDVNFVYAFHNVYGHNVYMSAASTFLTREEAVAAALRLKAEYEAELETEIQEIMARILANRATK